MNKSEWVSHKVGNTEKNEWKSFMKTKTKDDYRKSSINKRDFLFPNFQGIYQKKPKKGANRLWVAKDEWKPH